MSDLNRRHLLQTLLASLVSAGTVVLARATSPVTQTPTNDRKQPGPEERANQLASQTTAQSGQEPTAFVNRAFRNGGGFRNGGFRNGGFVNGGFRNGGFANGGFRNGAFRNGAFRNW